MKKCRCSDCAIIFQIITFWGGDGRGDGEVLHEAIKETSTEYALYASKEFTHVSPKYGLEVVTWGATLKKCEEIPAKDLLEELGFFIEFDGDGKGCR